MNVHLKLLEFKFPSSNLPPTSLTMELISGKVKVQIMLVERAKCTQFAKHCVDRNV
jgi:hypothetical protein